jgi:signal transduction histidine kinase
MRHNPFFRRIGCFFIFLNVLGVLLFVLFGSLALGGFKSPIFSAIRSWAWVLPASAIVLFVVVSTMVWGLSRVRQLALPLDELLAASESVAQGDYSARVTEKGPAEIRSLTRAFNSMAGRLEATDQRRRSLLSDVTHELRTPLTVIQGNLEAILDGVYGPDEARLRSILEETQVLSRLVDDLRTLALAESGALQLKKESVDLGALIRETATGFGSQADAAGVSLRIDVPPEPQPVEVDPARMREVLSNLLANALRYTPRQGEICIAYREEEIAGRPQALVAVTDSGPGIAPEDLPNVFDRFYKSSDSGGMGLGLSIARYLVEAHGGVIKAESLPGRGTTISLALPH